MTKNNNTQWRSFHVMLSSVTTINDYRRIDTLYRFLDTQFAILQADPRFVELAIENIDEYKTRFVSALAECYGKPYLNWNINNRAKYYRIMMTQVREVMAGLVKRRQLAEICQRYNWDTATGTLKAIQEEALDILGYRPKYRLISNLCQSKKIPALPQKVAFELDYSSEDDQVCEMVDSSLEHVCYKLSVDNTRKENRASLMIDVPTNIRKHVAHYARPNIIPERNERGDIVDYRVMISYEPVITNFSTAGENILGVDIGKLKAFSAAALYASGSVSGEFLATRETQRVLDKLNRVYDEVEATKKALAGCVDESKRCVLEGQLAGQRSKLSRLRDSFGRLVGRDVCACAQQLGCSVVHLEDLARLIAVGSQITGRWNFAWVRKCVVDECALYGVRVVLVNPSMTSRTDPFTNGEVIPRADRSVDCGCCVLDRDYLAALNIARCSGKRSVRKCGVISFGDNREALLLGARCCILESRKRAFK